MRIGRTGIAALVLVFVLASGCARVYAPMSRCPGTAPCDGHDGQPYCRQTGRGWDCCRCSRFGGSGGK